MQGTCQACHQEKDVRPTVVGEPEGDKTLRSLNLCADCAERLGGSRN